MLSLCPRKLIFFLFSKIKGFCEKTVYIRLIIYVKATYGEKKMKEIEFSTLATQYLNFADRRTYAVWHINPNLAA